MGPARPVEFVKSVAQQRELRKYFLSFYLDKNYHSRSYCCHYDIHRIRIFINLVRKRLIYDVFEHLVDFLVSIVQTRTKKCFDHLHHFSCLSYFPLDYRPRRGKTQSLVQFHKSHKFNLKEPFLILEVMSCNTVYGESFIIKFCCENKGYKTWLPKSGLEVIRRELDQDPVFFNFYDRDVYFRINSFSEYKGKKYAIIECKVVCKAFF